MTVTKSVPTERLSEIRNAKRTLTAVAYGEYPDSYAPLWITGPEIEQIVHELMALRLRNQRIAEAALDGNQSAAGHEYARKY